MSGSKVILGVITDGRSDMTLQCCVSLLHLQIDLMTNQNAFQADLRFYETMNDATNDLFVSKDFSGLFAVNYSAGVPGGFATKANGSDKDVVVGVHPMGDIDWERVNREIASTDEDLSHTGIVYNARLGGPQDPNGYIRVVNLDACDVLFIRRHVLETIAKNDPSVVSTDGKHSTFFAEGIYSGAFMRPAERFVSLCHSPIYADVELQCTKCSTAAFVGVVGGRRALR